MRNKKENKEKLEQRKQQLLDRIEEIRKYQVEIMLKNLLLSMRIDELEDKCGLIEQRLAEIGTDRKMPSQVLCIKDKHTSRTIILYMN